MKLLKDNKTFCTFMREIYSRKGHWPKHWSQASVKKALDWDLVRACDNDRDNVEITSEGVDFCERELGLNKGKPQ